jgi:aryl-alcohol dehydrogenase-like predicted oxidoreductase
VPDSRSDCFLFKYLEENMNAAHVRLTEVEIAAVRKIAESAAKNISGDRYS